MHLSRTSADSTTFCTRVQLHQNINETPKTLLFSPGTLLHLSDTWDYRVLIAEVLGTADFTLMTVLNLCTDSTCGYYLWI